MNSLTSLYSRHSDEELVALFDTDKSGTITLDELWGQLQGKVFSTTGRGMRQRDAMAILRELDSNGDASVSVAELVDSIHGVTKRDGDDY